MERAGDESTRGRSSPKNTALRNGSNHSPVPGSPVSSVASPSHQRSQQHAPPSAAGLLASLKPSFFDTPVDKFDEKFEALSGFGDSTDALMLLESLLNRVEEIDLARDVVTNSLANEVRRSSSSLISGMQQVQDLDLDVTRTSLHVTALRRRLAIAKRDLFEAELRVSKLSTRRDRLRLIETQVATLREASRLKIQCDAVVHPLSACIEATLETRDRLLKNFPQELSAIKSTVTGLSARIPRLEAAVMKNLRASLKGPRLEKDLFLDGLKCLEKLQKTEIQMFDIIKQLWFAMLESILSAPAIGKSNQQTKAKFSYGEEADEGDSSFLDDERPFTKVANSCTAFSQVLDGVSSAFMPSIGKDVVMTTRRESLGMLSKLAEDYLKSPLVRSQVLDEFAQTIEDATRLVDRVDEWFGISTNGTDETQYFNKTKMESSLRLRARIYAQQYQAEGFQAMRGLLWRESWVDVATAASTDSDPSLDFATAIFKRLGINPPKDETVANKRRQYVITATMGSGLPRQVQRTLDLMRKLPTNAAGEAFLGLLRIIDLYLLAIVATFVPQRSFFLSKKQMRTVGHIYMTHVKESLGEWLASSPRHSAPPPPLSPTNNSSVDTINAPVDDEIVDIKLCEFEFLADPEKSFEPAWVAAESLEFLLLMIRALEKPLSGLLPAVERVKLASKMFVELPSVIVQIKSLVRRSAVGRLDTICRFPDLTYVYEGASAIDQGPSDSLAQFACFNDCVYEMQVVFQQICSNPHLSDGAKMDLWDDAVALFFDKFVDAIAAMPSCSPMDRGNMIMHLASFWEQLSQIPGSRLMLSKAGQASSATRAKARADDFIKAFYYDKSADLWDWMRRKKEEFEPHHFLSILETGLVGQSAGSISYLSGANGTRAIGGRKELRQEFDRLMSSIFG